MKTVQCQQEEEEESSNQRPEKLDWQAAEAFTWCRMENFQRTCNEHHGFLDGIPSIKNYRTQGLSLSHPFSSFREVLVLVIPTSFPCIPHFSLPSQVFQHFQSRDNPGVERYDMPPNQ